MNKHRILADKIQGILLSSMPIEIKASDLDVALAKIMLAIKKAESITEFSTFSNLSDCSSTQDEIIHNPDQIQLFRDAFPLNEIKGRRGFKKLSTEYCNSCHKDVPSDYCSMKNCRKTDFVPIRKEASNE
jgi:hypothetical protein